MRPSALDKLVADIKACRACIEDPTGRPLPHDPRPVLRVSATARILVAGQAPGTRVHRSGAPFTDPSGDRLRDWMGVSLAEFYDDRRIAIAPMGFCFPGLDASGGDLPPRRECAPRWRSRLLALMPEIELILAIGQYAHRWHGDGRRRSVAEAVRDMASAADDDASPVCLALPHPSWRNTAWIRRNPWFDDDILPVVKRRVRILLERP